MSALARATRLLHVDRVPALVGLVLLLTSLAITAVGLGAPVDVPSCAFTKAVLCAELPASGSELARVLASAPNTPGDWALTTWIDMLLLAAYGALLVLGARRLGGARPGLARAVVALAVVGAALDVLENSGTLVAVGRVVDGAGAQVGDGLAALVAFAARAKFTALGLACAGIAVLAWPLRRRHVVVVGLLALGGAVALGASLVGWAGRASSSSAAPASP
ncbi:MAG: hypothetical protein U1F43_29425 [Myxococcota bacterium]